VFFSHNKSANICYGLSAKRGSPFAYLVAVDADRQQALHDQLLGSTEGAVIHRNWSLSFHSRNRAWCTPFVQPKNRSCFLFRSSDSLFDNWDAVIFFFFFNMFLTSNMELACHNFSDKILDFIFLYVASYILFPVLTYPFFWWQLNLYPDHCGVSLDADLWNRLSLPLMLIKLNTCMCAI